MATATGAIQLVDTLRVRLPAEGTAGTGGEYVLGYVEYAATVTAVRYMPDAAVTGAATNHKTLTVRNRGTAGAGTTATAAITFASGTNAAAFDATSLTLDATAANRDVAADSVVTLLSAVVGTGMTLPAGTIEVELTRN